MKKLVSLVIVAAMSISLVACQNSPEAVDSATQELANDVAEAVEENAGAIEEAVEDAATLVDAAAEETTDATEAEGAALTVEPLPAIEDINDATMWANIDMDTFDGENVDVNLFAEQYYDAVDMSMLKAGDTIMVNGDAIVVNGITTNDFGLTIINGGIEEGGAEFMAMEAGGVYQYSGMDGYPTYDDLGAHTLKISPDVVITDASDLENPDGTVLTIDEFKDFAKENELSRLNTSVRTEGGVIVEINIRFIP